jgi:hypothetical protein
MRCQRRRRRASHRLCRVLCVTVLVHLGTHPLVAQQPFVVAAPSPVPPPALSKSAPTVPVATSATYFAGPAVESRDYPAFQLATELLSSRFQYAVRYRSNLSYAAFAPFVGRAIAAGGIYASTTRRSPRSGSCASRWRR